MVVEPVESSATEPVKSSSAEPVEHTSPLFGLFVEESYG